MKYQPFLIIFAVSLHRLPYLQVCHNTLFASFSPNRAYPDGGTMSGMRYADTNFLIVTCYLLPHGGEPLLCLRSGFAMPSLQVRSYRWSINGLTTDLQRRYNGLTWKDYQSIFCVFTSFSMRSKRIQYDVNEIRIV